MRVIIHQWLQQCQGFRQKDFCFFLAPLARARWGLAGYCQLDPSHPAIVTCEDAEVEPCPKLELIFR